MKKELYLVIYYKKRPAKDVNTSIPGWKNLKNSIEVFETTEFHDSINDKLKIKSHTIIDILNNKCITSRFNDVSNEEITKHFMEKYQKSITEKLFKIFKKE